MPHESQCFNDQLSQAHNEYKVHHNILNYLSSICYKY